MDKEQRDYEKMKTDSRETMDSLTSFLNFLKNFLSYGFEKQNENKKIEDQRGRGIRRLAFNAEERLWSKENNLR